MSKWQYKREWYESVSFNWEEYSHFNTITKFFDYLKQNYVTIPIKYKDVILDEPLLYHKRWNKCYTLERFGYMGNDRNKLKMQLRDIYSGRVCYASAKDVEVVQECTPSLIQATLNLANKKSYVKPERPSNNRICRVGSISKPVARPF